MKLVGTRGASAPIDFHTALFRPLAPDGGLWQPTLEAPLPEETLRGFRESSFPEVSLEVTRHLLDDELDGRSARAIVREALGFLLPLRRITDRLFVLELFHGPTLAFKDIGARFLARTMAHFERATGREPATILVATSGDTGSAVGHAFQALASNRVVILYPRGKVSRLQERHLAGLGGRVEPVAVEGTFDDCQRLVKAAFADPELREEALLASANSINVGRLFPQTFYYFHAWSRVRARIAPSERAEEEAVDVVFSVPSGNFGNLAAGLLAKRLGLAGVHFVAATNANDVVPEYLETGVFSPRPSVRTLSNAMDVGNPSNFERILHLCGHDVDRVRRELGARSYGDDATRRCILEVHERHGYLLDPHSAVGWLALEDELARRPEAMGVLLATAHPAKFAEVVEPLVGRPVPVPERFTRGLRPARRPIPLEPEPAALRELLLKRRPS